MFIKAAKKFLYIILKVLPLFPLYCRLFFLSLKCKNCLMKKNGLNYDGNMDLQSMFLFFPLHYIFSQGME